MRDRRLARRIPHADGGWPRLVGSRAATLAPRRDSFLGPAALDQDVAIPAGTTALTLRGQYDVRTSELFPLGFDFGYVEITSTTGSVLETVLTLSDAGATTGWTAFSHALTGHYAGQTVRI